MIFLIIALIHSGIFFWTWFMNGEFDQVQLLSALIWLLMYRVGKLEVKDERHV